MALPVNESGALLTLLEQFSVRGVDLSRIESRPSGDGLGNYTFSIDIVGHIREERVQAALVGLHRYSPEVRFMGSYPRVDGVRASVAPGPAARRRRHWQCGRPRAVLAAGLTPHHRAPRAHIGQVRARYNSSARVAGAWQASYLVQCHAQQRSATRQQAHSRRTPLHSTPASFHPSQTRQACTG